MRDLTGAPSFEYDLKKELKEKQNGLYGEIEQWLKQEYLLNVTSQLDYEGVETEGIISHHSYGLVNVMKVGDTQLVQLWNPYGQSSWKG